MAVEQHQRTGAELVSTKVAKSGFRRRSAFVRASLPPCVGLSRPHLLLRVESADQSVCKEVSFERDRDSLAFRSVCALWSAVYFLRNSQV